MSLWWTRFCVVVPIERGLKVEEASQIICIEGLPVWVHTLRQDEVRVDGVCIFLLSFI